MLPDIHPEFWHWLVLGLVFVTIEPFVPGTFFLWMGISAGIVVKSAGEALLLVSAEPDRSRFAWALQRLLALAESSNRHEAEAATVASAVPGASLEIDEDLGGLVEIVIGADSANGLVVQSPTDIGQTITGLPAVGASKETPLELPEDLEHVNAAGELCA